LEIQLQTLPYKTLKEQFLAVLHISLFQVLYTKNISNDGETNRPMYCSMLVILDRFVLSFMHYLLY